MNLTKMLLLQVFLQLLINILLTTQVFDWKDSYYEQSELTNRCIEVGKEQREVIKKLRNYIDDM